MPARPVYVLHASGRTPIRQASARHGPGPETVANHELGDRDASNHIESLAAELFAMDNGDPSLFELPVGEWLCVNLRDIPNHVWFYSRSNRRPDYCQNRVLHEKMIVQELQNEATIRHLKLLHTEKAFLLDVLKVNSGAFTIECRKLREHNTFTLRSLVVKYDVDIHIDYLYSRNELAFLIADRIARDAVDTYNASVRVSASL